MKQNRALSVLLFGNLSREKRRGLIALALLFLSLGLLVLSQRPWRPPGTNTPRGASTGAGANTNTGLGTGASTETNTNTNTGLGAAPNTGTATGPSPGTNTATNLNPTQPPTPAEIAPATLAYPLDGDILIAQSFHSIDGAYGDLRYFDAVAWRASLGQAVRAAAKGRIIQVSSSPGEGMQIWVDHGGGMVTRYAGLAITLVSEGAPVTARQVLGEVGPPTEIRSMTGPHLTFGVTLNGATLDPNLYLRK